MAEDVFAGDQTSVSVLDTLVGEGKKFDDVEALAKGKAQSDEHIATIEQENAALKEQLARSTVEDDKAGQVKELLAAVKAQAATKENESPEGGKTMSSEELTEIVNNAIKDDRSAETKAANRARGNALVLGKVEGNVEAAQLLVAERAKALGLTVGALAELSESSPDAFATLVGANDGTVLPTGSTSQLPSMNTDALSGQVTPLELEGFKTKAWFDAQRKELGPAGYINSPRIQGELVRSMNGLGERFNN